MTNHAGALCCDVYSSWLRLGSALFSWEPCGRTNKVAFMNRGLLLLWCPKAVSEKHMMISVNDTASLLMKCVSSGRPSH